MVKISIANDYTRTPGSRYIYEGPFSGEDFREQLLYPKYLEAIQGGDGMEVDLDGCYGYATSFLEEAFGGLVRKTKKKGLLDFIKVKSEDDVTLIALIQKYVAEEEKKL